MPLETGTYISDLVVSNPAASDGLNNADDHIRLIKAALKNTFPNINSIVNITDEALNVLAANPNNRFPSGSSAAPGIAWVDETGLGFYRTGAAAMAFTGRLSGDGVVPAGMVMDFAAATAPPGWIALDGAVLATATYPALFAAIGYTWGGSGASFVLPNASSGGRFRRHRDNAAYSGAVGTYQNTANLSHAHTGAGDTGQASADHTHSVSGNTAGMSANVTHDHTTLMQTGVLTSASFGGYSAFFQPSGVATNAGFSNSPASSAANLEHGHPFAATSGGMSTGHYHAYSFTTTASGDPLESRPWCMTMLACIKV